MKLAIVAATGGIGRQLLDQALAAGHDVTAVVRSPAKLPAGVRAVPADLATVDPATLEPAFAGADAVLSGLGPRSGAEVGVATRGTGALIDAAWAVGVRRIVVVSAAPLGTVPSPGRPNPPKSDPGDGFFMRTVGSRFAKFAFRHHYADLATMEDLLRDSDLEWTIVRPPRLTNRPLTGRYRIAYGQNVRGGWFASRADVAHYMLRALAEPGSIRQTVGIAT